MGGRVIFVGNPWPGGHEIAELQWTGVLRRTGLWLGLYLRTARYDDEVGEDFAVRGHGDWGSPTVWCNHSRCTIRPALGFLAATPHSPLSIADLPERIFNVDGNPGRPDAVDTDDEDDVGVEFQPVDAPDYAAFSIYLLGHDAIAQHRIMFSGWHGGNAVSLDWRARIALAYAGDHEYRYQMRATAEFLQLDTIDIADDLGIDDAELLLPLVLSDAAAFTFQADEHCFRYQTPRALSHG